MWVHPSPSLWHPGLGYHLASLTPTLEISTISPTRYLKVFPLVMVSALWATAVVWIGFDFVWWKQGHGCGDVGAGRSLKKWTLCAALGHLEARPLKESSDSSYGTLVGSH